MLKAIAPQKKLRFEESARLGIQFQNYFEKPVKGF